MKWEKSCGALVYRYHGGGLELLLIRHRFGGHWSFPKGHVEQGESESQTALREVKEETNISISLEEGFRECVEYYPKPYIKKQVIYFLGRSLGDTPKRQEEEISELRWVPIDQAERMVSFDNDKNLIRKSRDHLSQKPKSSQA